MLLRIKLTANYYFQLFLLTSGTYQTILPQCRYGLRGSLTAICTNAMPSFFRSTLYHFDHLDETLQCINCTLTNLVTGTFDIAGNRIQTLDLTGSQIETIEGKAFTGMIFMEKLIMNDNQIKQIDLEAFLGARKVKELFMNNAIVGDLEDNVFKHLYLLTRLHLSNNSFTNLSKITFNGLWSLEYLDLSYNKIKTLNQAISHLPSLQLVKLNCNEISRIAVDDFQNLPSIVDVDLSSNLISGLNISLHTLRRLNLSNNHLGNEVVKVGTFNHLPKLEILDLSLNWFNTIPSKLFLGLHQLKELILYRNNLKTFQSGSFSGLPSLRKIDLSHNLIYDLIVTGRLSLTNVHVLDLSNNKIQDMDFAALIQKLPSVAVIDLTNNKLPCNIKRRLELYASNDSIVIRMDLDQCPELDKGVKAEALEMLKDEVQELEQGRNSDTVKWIFVVILMVMVVGLYLTHFFVIVPLRRRL